MSVVELYGTFGKYYASLTGTSEPLNLAQMQTNALYIYGYFNAQGWTVNACSAILGNMEHESAINPSRWQSDSPNSTSLGYGLVQWTPATKYINWATSNGFTDYGTMDANLARIKYEVYAGNVQWFINKNYNYNLSFKDFMTSTKAPSYLAKAFLVNYERPKNSGTSVQNKRGASAESWYTFLTGESPPKPQYPFDEGVPSHILWHRGYNFLLFNKSRKLVRRK